MLVWNSNDICWVEADDRILLDGDVGIENNESFIRYDGEWIYMLSEEMKMVNRLKEDFEPSQRVEIFSHFCPKCGSDKFKCLCKYE